MVGNPGLALVILCIILVLGWYAVGTQFNVRRGHEALKWLQKGLPVVGERATLRWLGSSVVELKLNKAKEPFRSAEVLVVMEPRDVPVMWLWAHQRGRRDIMIFRAQLRSAPNFDLEARLPRNWGDQDFQQADGGHWRSVQGGLGNGMLADYRGDISPLVANRLVARAALDGTTVTRLSVRRKVPNLEVRMRLPNFEAVPTRRVFESLRQLAEAVLEK